MLTMRVLWVVAGMLAFVGMGLFFAWITRNVVTLKESQERLRRSEHRQSNMLHVLLNVELAMAKRMGVDVRTYERVLTDSGEKL